MSIVAKENRSSSQKGDAQKITEAQNKEIFMIKSLSKRRGSDRKASFRLLAAFITVLFACSVTVTAFAAANNKRVVVSDGEKSVSLSAKTADPLEIVELAGFKLEPNDRLDLSGYDPEEGGTISVERAKVIRVEDGGLIAYLVGYNDRIGSFLGKSGISIGENDDPGVGLTEKIFDGMKIFIRRAFPVTVDADGETRELFLTGGSTADALKKAGVRLGPDDVVAPSLDSALNGFTKIRVKRVGYKIKSEKLPIDFETKVVGDPDMFIGEEKIVSQGGKGEKIVFYTEKYVDGVLSETVFLRETVVKRPEDRVKKTGLKKKKNLAAFKDTGAAISDLNAPDDLKLDKNGIPVDYAYCVDAKATAYAGDPATASGRKPTPGYIAVDPKEYPYGTELYIVSSDGSYVYGYSIAADTGGFVSMGNADVDLYMANEDMCDDWGNRKIKIYVLK